MSTDHSHRDDREQPLHHRHLRRGKVDIEAQREATTAGTDVAHNTGGNAVIVSAGRPARADAGALAEAGRGVALSGDGAMVEMPDG